MHGSSPGSAYIGSVPESILIDLSYIDFTLILHINLRLSYIDFAVVLKTLPLSYINFALFYTRTPRLSVVLYIGLSLVLHVPLFPLQVL